MNICNSRNVDAGFGSIAYRSAIKAAKGQLQRFLLKPFEYNFSLTYLNLFSFSVVNKTLCL